jgi:preprotein translocase subunit SecG
MEMIINVTTIVSAVLMIILILMQARGASLGAGFGGSSELHTARRGVDKTIYQATIIMAIIFVVSIVVGIVAG